MAEFYDKGFEEPIKPEFDLDMITPDGRCLEIILEQLPKVGEKFYGYTVEKVELDENPQPGDRFAKVILK